ncbi:MAG: thiamine pyrophosphate-dependent enzyme [Pirellulaceae bacterium]|nr:thiamine pyrophosphate-dependent enzyme [Pirellulaceae bacterium]
MNPEWITQGRIERAQAIAQHGTIRAAVEAGTVGQFADITMNEALLLGLHSQGVRKYVGIFGHGSTDLGEILRIYEAAGIQTFAVHHEVLAAHAATTLYWQYGETAAVFTSIGPGALHALAGSLTGLSNGAGVYYLLGDETTYDEGPNMQQIPRREQGLFLQLTSTLGPSYTLHTPQAINTALRNGMNATKGKVWPSPFYMLLPMNTQPEIIQDCNLLGFPEPMSSAPQVCGSEGTFAEIIEAVQQYDKITIKIGGGAQGIRDELVQLADLVDAAVVSGPQVPGVFPPSNLRHMAVGGSKGSICGNFAMAEAELVFVIGARAVCQWDSSGVAWKKVQQFINFNTNPADALHYNRTIPVIGDAKANLQLLIQKLRAAGVGKSTGKPSVWLTQCVEKRAEWTAFCEQRFIEKTRLYDEVFDREVLTQPAAIKTACDFAKKVGAVKFFDAGDVQANGFQIVEDEEPGFTFTDVGASYMGFAASSLLAAAMADEPQYGMAICGEGSFLMNPQILIDATEHQARGMIVILDNRRMAAITGLQWAQYGHDYATNDSVPVDYVALCNAVRGVHAISGGTSCEELTAAFEEAYRHEGLSVVHVPVYCGKDEMGGLGAYGQWNVGNWCEDVQKEHQRLGV